MKQVIYETTGRAREFSELACNCFTGCEHGCIYCFAPTATHREKEKFLHPEIRVNPEEVRESATKLVKNGERRSVLFSFACDPYTPMEQDSQLTRRCIMAMHDAGLNVTILTKGGLRSMRDFDLLTDKDAYATTLTCLWDTDSLKWEPMAAVPSERIRALIEANKRGIETWVSFEPVIYPEQTRELLRLVHKITNHVKIGTMNYHPRGKEIDWYSFGWGMKELCDQLSVSYYFKKDLLREMGVSPETFQQTATCC